MVLTEQRQLCLAMWAHTRHSKQPPMNGRLGMANKRTCSVFNEINVMLSDGTELYENIEFDFVIISYDLICVCREHSLLENQMLLL